VIIHLEEVGLASLPIELLGDSLLASLMAAEGVFEMQAPAEVGFELESYSAPAIPQFLDSSTILV